MKTSPKKQFVLTEEMRSQILSHIRYEITKSFLLPEHDPKNQLLAESVQLTALLHARQLLDFFTRSRSNNTDDDVCCFDFGFSSKPIDLPSEHRERFNKDFAHLTYARLRHRPEERAWDVGVLLPPLRCRSVEFMRHIIASPPKLAHQGELAEWEKFVVWVDRPEPFTIFRTT